MSFQLMLWMCLLSRPVPLFVGITRRPWGGQDSPEEARATRKKTTLSPASFKKTLGMCVHFSLTPISRNLIRTDRLPFHPPFTMFDLLADFGDSDEFLLPSSASGGVDLDQQLQLVPVESASQPPSEPLQRKPELGLCEAKAQYNAFYGSSLQGKCGKGRHGSQYERCSLMLHLRTIKMHRRVNYDFQCFEDVMKHVEQFNRFKKQCQVKLNRYTRRAKACVVKRSLKGNQHKHSVPDPFFPVSLLPGASIRELLERYVSKHESTYCNDGDVTPVEVLGQTRALNAESPSCSGCDPA